MLNIIRQTFFIFLVIATENMKTIELFISMILLLSMIIYLKFLPRITRIYNIIEFLSLFSCFLTSFCIYFIDDRIPNVLKYILIMFLACVHLLFLFLIFLKLGKEFWSKCQKKLKKYVNSLITFLNQLFIKKRSIKFFLKQMNDD